MTTKLGRTLYNNNKASCMVRSVGIYMYFYWLLKNKYFVKTCQDSQYHFVVAKLIVSYALFILWCVVIYYLLLLFQFSTWSKLSFFFLLFPNVRKKTIFPCLLIHAHLMVCITIAYIIVSFVNGIFQFFSLLIPMATWASSFSNTSWHPFS